MRFKCKECGESFSTKKSLHSHFKKHDLLVGEYYVKHFPRFDKLTKDPIGFKRFEQYFASNFNTDENMEEWCKTAPEKEVREFILEEFKHKVIKKGIKAMPSSVFLKTAGLPDIDVIKRVFGSYSALAAELDFPVAYRRGLAESFWKDYSGVDVFVDTRETKPLVFKNSKTMKLDFGDYSLTAKDYTHTHVERKSWEDFALTVTGGYKRFLRELERCKRSGCYMFIVVETNLNNVEKKNNFAYKRVNLNYVFHQMREIEIKYQDVCQFVFSGSRPDSTLLIPKLLCLGQEVRHVDIQYFWDKHLEKHGLGKRESTTTQTFRGYKPKALHKRRLFGGV